MIFNVKSKNFCLVCTHCGHIMPLENMEIIQSYNQLLGPCVEITCTVCDNKDYLIGKMDWL